MSCCFIWGCAAVLACLLWAVARWAVIPAKVWDFTTSNVFLTGGSSGIGLEVAKSLARKRVKHLVIAARREPLLLEAVKEIEGVIADCNSPTVVHYVVVDVSQDEAVNAALANAEHLCGKEAINLLICSAGSAYPARFSNCTMTEARSMMNSNYFGCVNAMLAVLPGMLQSGRGRVVLVSSLAALAPHAGYSLYAPAKAAVRALAHSVDMENSCLGVRVQIASPPDVETPGFVTENLIKSPECHAISSFGGSHPLKAKDMADAIVRGIEHYTFDVTLGSDGFLLSMGSAGMEPPSETWKLMLGTLISGPLRLVLCVFTRFHYNLVAQVRASEAATALPVRKKLS